MEDTHVITIDRLAYGGDGVGRLEDGKVVFVPFVIPGEVVRVRLAEEKAHHARAELVEMIEPSVERIQPRCMHFSVCGGCHYQHMTYPAQLAAKASILKEQLERIGGITDIPDITIIPSPQPWYYRNHLQFHLTHDGKLGFQAARTNQPFAIQECHLPEMGINQLWPKLEIEPLQGLERVSLRQGAEEELMIVLECSSTTSVEFSIEDLDVSVIQTDPAGSVVLAGSDQIFIEVLGKRFTVSSGSFFQVNTRQAENMVTLLLDQLRLDKGMTVLDVYSGVGLFSAFIAPLVKRLVGIEVSADACEDYIHNLDDYDNVELYEATAEQVLGNVPFKPDVIVLDPPRTGLGHNTVDGLLAQGASTVAYISCDPATLARDGKQISSGGYRVEKLFLVDMFPHTYHIESLSMWKMNI